MKPITSRTNRKGLLTLLLAAVMTMSACAGAAGSSQTTAEATEQTFTLEELALYDGLEGRKAYIAVDGVVYDVTAIPQWQDGLHQRRFQAGKDYSQEIRSESPHGLSMLSRAVKVGVLAEQD
jgi:predicted heme/steroid binding protein